MTKTRIWLHVASAAAVTALATSGAQAQTEKGADGPVLIVGGEAEVEHAPDWVVLNVDLRGEGKTQAEAVAAMSALRDRLEGDLAILKGGPVVGVSTSTLDVQVVRGKECGKDDDDSGNTRAVLSQGACAPLGAVAKVELNLKISPATALGEVAAHAVAVGAEKPEVENSGVTDMDALKREAMRRALANAQAKAETIAAASGRKLGAVTRIQDASARIDEDLANEYRYHDAPASIQPRLAKAPPIAIPAPALSLTAPTVTANAEVAVVYRLQ